MEEELKKLSEVTPIEQERNPLKWYWEHRNEFPLSTKLYIKYASVQATSVPSERVFNIASMTYDDRPLLLPEKAEKTVVVNDYYRSRDNDANFTLCHHCQPARYKIMCLNEQHL